MNTQKTWFVTGASKGLGLSLVKQLLQKGYNVAATSRNQADLLAAVGEHESFLPLAVNIKAEDSVTDAINQTLIKFGKIDVVVNNAGYGLTGSLEELSDAEARENFDVNVFGSLNVIRGVMPHLRAQQSGHIFNISSIGGFTGNFPGFGIYCATKFAVQGFTESLAAEAKSFGIKATIVSPGYFRTNFLMPDSLSTPKNEIAEYKEVREVQAAHQNDINGNQAGDPEKAAEVMIKVAEAPEAPVHLFLGADAYALADQKIEYVKADMNTWRELATSTGFETANV
ncbi:SDR family NAD(P)-dependent oxidoreductase [Mucilaginibacter limnophilus]|uniref:SDR family NAD(P)-dependent oxidoreductase n=1 Tax=Mucilaginibacter limnophilus TaxID=1932778 RepID=A0A3S2URH1_9SPHI|nr:SDR family NAD(P)-dependent oxidoreductase [Mucilaginibacter limnophilus]RVU02859.1 SDR family NAD(P)-dependent oxidoreductase [Mucilaginibacter limnophilus]